MLDLPSSRRPEASHASELGRVASFDLMRVIAGFAVVLLHCAAPLLVHHHLAEGGWWAGNLYDSSVRWCVPLFVMLSGALLLGKDESVGRFFQKRLRKVMLPLVFWSFFYLAWNAANGKAVEWRRLLESPAYFHLWFFYMLIGLYVLTPILRAFLRTASRRIVYYALFVWVLWASILPTLEVLLDFDATFIPAGSNSPLHFLGYYVLGFVLRDQPFASWRERGLSALAFLVGFVATVLGTYQETVLSGGGELGEAYYEYWSGNVALMALGVFVLCRGAASWLGAPERRVSRRYLLGAAEAVLGVYLAHVVVLELVRDGRLGFTLRATTVHPAFGVPLLTAVVFGLSLGLVLLMRRMPLVRHVVP
jgi:surface polysaccharide O-acyltransferase-like enzyme